MHKIISKNNVIDPITFYNAHAGAYNRHLESDISNITVRNKAAACFVEAVKGKNILDFGGGTGLDLPWLIKNNYQISFCEPSEKMREIAISLNQNELKSNKIKFLQQEQANFMKWNNYAFAEPFDAILANFAVFNSISNPQLLFSKLSLIIKPQGHIIATMLDTTPSGIVKRYLKNFIAARLRNSIPVLITGSDEYRQCAYLHTPGVIIAAAVGFKCVKTTSISGTGFMLIHLQKQ